MPNKCCVPYCRGNYDKENKVRTSSFPTDKELKQIWLQKISRQNFEPTKNSRVCERHFEQSCWESYEELFDEKRGEKISIKLYKPRLKKTAIPTIFPNYPAHKNVNTGETRISPDECRSKQEEQNIEEAMRQSLETHQEYEKERCFKTIEELNECLQEFQVSKFWDIVQHGNILDVLYESLNTNRVPCGSDSLCRIVEFYC